MKFEIEAAAIKRERYEAEKAKEASAWLDEAVDRCLPIIIRRVNNTNSYTECTVALYDNNFPNTQFPESKNYKAFKELIVDFFAVNGYGVKCNFVSSPRDDGKGVNLYKIEFTISW